MSESIMKKTTPAQASSEPTRLVPAGWDESGNVVVRSLLTPKAMKTRAMCLVPSDLIVPIVFVPGIMGTRLRSTRDRNSGAWLPPENIVQGVWAALQGTVQSSAKRQRLLNPRFTEVDDTGPAFPSDTAKHLLAIAPGGTSAERAKWRGWGALHGDSYEVILNELEERFALIFDPQSEGRVLHEKWRSDILIRNTAMATGAQKPFDPLTEDELKDAAELSYPVHAVGYNWLKSNRQSGEYLLDKIDKIIGHYRKMGKACEKVIIVTHSMGGLVARACMQLPGAENRVHGVVHGVMPAIGAPVTYKRIRAGCEGVEQLVLGRGAADCTAVMANAPGPLELLPTASYQTRGRNGQFRHWLRVSHRASSWQQSNGAWARDVFLGGIDPFAEIYASDDKNRWWRLVKEELINPAKESFSEMPRKRFVGDKKFADDFERFLINLDSAQRLHGMIESKYHPCTYFFYAADTFRPTWKEVCWQGVNPDMADPISGETISDDHWGTVELRLGRHATTFSMLPASGHGDGTVPAESGEAPTPFAIQAFRHGGRMAGHESYDHQGAFSSSIGRAVTCYSIVKIMASSKWKDMKCRF